jgi:hypothetical protein
VTCRTPRAQAPNITRSCSTSSGSALTRRPGCETSRAESWRSSAPLSVQPKLVDQSSSQFGIQGQENDAITHDNKGKRGMLWAAKARINLKFAWSGCTLLSESHALVFAQDCAWNPHAQAQASRVKPALATNIPLSLCYHKAQDLPFSTSLRALLLAETSSATLHTQPALSCQANPTPEDSQVFRTQLSNLPTDDTFLGVDLPFPSPRCPAT